MPISHFCLFLIKHLSLWINAGHTGYRYIDTKILLAFEWGKAKWSSRMFKR